MILEYEDQDTEPHRVGDDNDSVPSLLAGDQEVTEPHATKQWFEGFDVGYRRGIGDAMDGLRQSLRDVGLDSIEAERIAISVRKRIPLALH